ncbi:41703_t:CDS:2, partial [Gigaspora margarita]
EIYKRRKYLPSIGRTTENFAEQRSNVIDYLTKHLEELLPEDVVILDKSSIDSLTPRTGIRATIELKKKIQSSHLKQVTLEMIAADLFVKDEIKVFAVMTDLNMTVKISHRNKALDLISNLTDLYKKPSKEVCILGLRKIRRVKIHTLFDMLNDDIESEDSYNEEKR